jgi:hypothetical protein
MMARICVICKAEIPPDYKGIKYCPDCRKEGYRQAYLNYDHTHRSVEVDYLTPPSKVLDEAADEVERYNNAHGTHLSYGMYTYLKDSGRLEK